MTPSPSVTEEQLELVAKAIAHSDGRPLWDMMIGVAKEHYVVLAVAALSAMPGQRWRVPEGWKLVPVEPTKEMVMNSVACWSQENGGLEAAPYDIWKAMLAAAPPPPAQERGDGIQRGRQTTDAVLRHGQG